MKLTDKSSLVMASVVMLVAAAIILTVMSKENRKNTEINGTQVRGISFKVGPVYDTAGHRKITGHGSYSERVYAGYPGHPEYGPVTQQEMEEGRYNNYQYYRPDTIVGLTDGTRKSSQHPQLWTLGYPVIEANQMGEYRVKTGPSLMFHGKFNYLVYVKGSDRWNWRHTDEERDAVTDSATAFYLLTSFLNFRHWDDSIARLEDLKNKADWDATRAGKKEFHKIK